MPKFVETFLEIKCKKFKEIVEVTEDDFEGGFFEFFTQKGLEILNDHVKFPNKTPVIITIMTHDDSVPRNPHKVMEVKLSWKKDKKGCAWAHLETDLPYMEM